MNPNVTQDEQSAGTEKKNVSQNGRAQNIHCDNVTPFSLGNWRIIFSAACKRAPHRNSLLSDSQCQRPPCASAWPGPPGPPRGAEPPARSRPPRPEQREEPLPAAISELFQQFRVVTAVRTQVKYFHPRTMYDQKQGDTFTVILQEL